MTAPFLIGLGVCVVAFFIGAGLHIALSQRGGPAADFAFGGAVVACISVLGFLATFAAMLLSAGDHAREQDERYRTAAAAHLDSAYDLRPLSFNRDRVPHADNKTVWDVRMERGNDLFTCVLNTRVGPSSITAHCKPYQP